MPDHRSIHDRAVLDLKACGWLPADWTEKDSKSISDANIDEDMNFVRKADYSHYYNPWHKINMPRFDSSVSVNEAQTSIEAAIASKALDRKTLWQMAGRVTHHLQDSAVPLHVIPVQHDPLDGFERLKVNSWQPSELNPEDCREMKSSVPLGLGDLLHESALETYRTLHEQYELSWDGATVKTSFLGSFWFEGVHQEFGSYGFLGNSFGLAKIKLGSINVEVDESVYRNFKFRRIEQARGFTSRVLLWFLSKF